MKMRALSNQTESESHSVSVLLFVTAWTKKSLVLQGLRIHLPMQGAWVRSLVWEDPTCLEFSRQEYWGGCQFLLQGSCTHVNMLNHIIEKQLIEKQ